MPDPTRPTICRLVHYVVEQGFHRQPPLLSYQKYDGIRPECVAGIIVKVNDDDTVNIFTPPTGGGSQPQHTTPMTRVDAQFCPDTLEYRTWHWATACPAERVQ